MNKHENKVQKQKDKKETANDNSTIAKESLKKQNLLSLIEMLKDELELKNSQIIKLQKKENNFLGTNKIYNLDCLELFKKMKENKIMVDAIITDPPYNISKINNFTSLGRAGIDFGLWDYGFDQTTWIKESYSLVKKGGSIIIFNDWRNFGEISKTLEEVGYEVKDILRWIKKNPMPRNTGRRYVTDYELAIWAVKNGEKWTFNFKKDKNKPYLIPQYEGSIDIGKKRIHPTQKSLQVFKGIIQTHTNIGDLVLDPFIGSGTTAVACRELNRNFIGSEIDSDYFRKAKLRIGNQITNKILVDEAYIKSPINYTGNKYKLLKQIIPFFLKK